MTTGTRPYHDVCFLNLLTPAGEREKRFYSEVLGWTYGPMPGVLGGSLVLVEGKIAGALMDLDVSTFPPGTPPVIGLLFKSESLEATTAEIRRLGGMAEAPMDILENGRMAMCTDPGGASFGLWQPKKEQGIDCDSHAHGAPGWFEVFSADARGSASFYTQLFGWTAEESPLPDGATYTVFKLGGRPCAGAMTIEKELAGMPPHWSTAFTVRDADVAAEAVERLGGKIHMPVMAIQDVGRFAAVSSPGGVGFSIVEWAGPRR